MAGLQNGGIFLLQFLKIGKYFKDATF